MAGFVGFPGGQLIALSEGEGAHIPKGSWRSHVGKESWSSGSPGPVLCWPRHHLPKPPTVLLLSREGGNEGGHIPRMVPWDAGLSWTPVPVLP